METVTILRELWRRRLLVVLAALVAIFVGLALTYRLSLPPESRQYEVGVASTRILVDTPNSQVVDVAPRGSETLGTRANLLANLMTQGKVKAAIADRAGLSPKRVLASAESAGGAETGTVSAEPTAKDHVLTTRLVANADGEPLPIIEIEAQAPSAAGAGRLAEAAVAGLDSYLDSKAAVEEVSDARRLRVTGMGAPVVREAVRGPGRAIALGAAVFVFLAGCAAILIGSALVRGWRSASAHEAGVPEDGGPTLHSPFGRNGRSKQDSLVYAGAAENGERSGEWKS